MTFLEFTGMCLEAGFTSAIISESDFNNLDYHSEPYLQACVDKAAQGYSFEYFSSVLLRKFKRS